jgi:hypothetical protein
MKVWMGFGSLSLARLVRTRPSSSVCVYLSRTRIGLHCTFACASQLETTPLNGWSAESAKPAQAGGMVRTPYGSSRETKLLYAVVNRLESIKWAYTITRGSPITPPNKPLQPTAEKRGG